MYHNLCFEQKYEKREKNSTENCLFYSREKSLYVAWACFCTLATVHVATQAGLCLDPKGRFFSDGAQMN